MNLPFAPFLSTATRSTPFRSIRRIRLAPFAAAACVLMFAGCNSGQQAGHAVQSVPRSSQKPGVAGMSISETVLMPETPIATKQNFLIRTANAGGRDYAMLLGPGPGETNEATAVMHNSEATLELTAGTVIIKGVKPIVYTHQIVTASWGTAFAVWATEEGDYVVGVEVDPTKPVTVTLRSDASKTNSLLQGQYIFVPTGATSVPAAGSITDEGAGKAAKLFKTAKTRLAAAALTQDPD